MLIEHGADIRALSCNEWQAPLLSAVAAGHYRVVEELVRRGTPSALYVEALQLAATNKREVIVRFLLDQGRNLPEFEVLQAAELAGNQIIIECLLEQLKHSNSTNRLREYRRESLRLMMLTAARKGDTQFVQNAVEKFCSVITDSFRGATDDALREATRFNDVKAGADANSTAPDPFSRYSHLTPLQSIIYYENLGAVKAFDIILEFDARFDGSSGEWELDAHGSPYNNVLKEAAWAGKLDLVRLLLDRGFDFDSHFNGTNTPLFGATMTGHARRRSPARCGCERERTCELRPCSWGSREATRPQHFTLQVHCL
ncbi:hypothetical protein K458DRAFT_406531 [Lentithecium fluviatile CBS 122367]|uniref:Ankyrin n=1 Tax=Lentithecium fluviatile CBS 122367 TaxID=1168545 RepID=A0A6G1IUC1_9PLEO|nr:hypothetical protein K458DRAFT_406531 [Lentithecium fluviatile CBS 122367]